MRSYSLQLLRLARSRSQPYAINSRATALVKAWTNRAFTLGLTTTSRVESSHAAPKKRLQTSTGHMKTVVDRISGLIDHQNNEIHAEIKQRRTSLAARHRIALFAHVVGEICPIGLDIVLAEQRRLANRNEDDPLPPCSHVFTTTLGLPCAHLLESLALTRHPLLVAHFHPFWKYDRLQLQPPLLAINPALLALRDPPIVRPRGCPRGALGRSPQASRAPARRRESRSTRREPSYFELIEQGESAAERARRRQDTGLGQGTQPQNTLQGPEEAIRQSSR